MWASSSLVAAVLVVSSSWLAPAAGCAGRFGSGGGEKMLDVMRGWRYSFSKKCRSNEVGIRKWHSIALLNDRSLLPGRHGLPGLGGQEDVQHWDFAVIYWDLHINGCAVVLVKPFFFISGAFSARTTLSVGAVACKYEKAKCCRAVQEKTTFSFSFAVHHLSSVTCSMFCASKIYGVSNGDVRAWSWRGIRLHYSNGLRRYSKISPFWPFSFHEYCIKKYTNP